MNALGRAARPAASGSRWTMAALIAGAATGAALGAGSRFGLLLAASGGVVLAVTLPLPWIAIASVVASVTFRLAAPSAAGPVSDVPDAVLLIVLVHAGVDWMLDRASAAVPVVRRMAIPLGLFVGLAVASTIYNGDTMIGLVASLRQFVRFPLWAFALLVAGIGQRDGKRLVGVVLGLAVLQFPVAFFQYSSTSGGGAGGVFYRGDPVSGTFGQGGSGVMMVFLVLATTTVVALVIERVLPVWVLFAAAPLLVLPMAWGSAALFVLLLPMAIVALLLRSAVSRGTGLRPAVAAGGAILILLTGWAAGSIAHAPGFAGSGGASARELLSDSYLRRYVARTGADQPGSRIGFLRFAAETDLAGGPGGVLLGQGPSASIIGHAADNGTKVSLSRFARQSATSVWSVQRLLLGYGFIAVALLALVIALPSVVRAGSAPPGTGRALAMVLPVAGFLMLMVGPYNSAWSDPGLASAYWALVVAAHATMRPPSPTGDGEESA